MSRTREHPAAAPAKNRLSGQAVSAPGIIRLCLCGRNWTLHRPTDLESLWNSIEDDAFALDERLPYWVELWPSSLALGVWLERNKERINGKICLDLGCGLGFTALLASLLGARVLAMDYETEALSYAVKNAAANAVPSPLWLAMDWRKPALAARSCEYIWGGDIMYERRFVMPVLDFLDHALSASGIAWIAEPSRETYNDFQRALLAKKWRSRCVFHVDVEALHDQKVPVPVRLWELGRY